MSILQPVLRSVIRPDMRDIMNQGGGGFSSAYQAVYDSMTTKPSASVAAAQDTMVKSLVDGGVWTLLDVFYLFAQESNGDGEALKNWVTPGTHDATMVSAPAFASLEGFKGNGSSSYINSNYNPGDGGTYNLSLNSACFGIYFRTKIDGATYEQHGSRTSNSRIEIYRENGSNGSSKARINADNGAAVTGTAIAGMYTALRTSSSITSTYVNKDKNTVTVNSVLIPDLDIAILAENNDNTIVYYDGNQVAVSFLGAGLTEAKQNILYDAIQTYMTSNSKQV